MPIWKGVIQVEICLFHITTLLTEFVVMQELLLFEVHLGNDPNQVNDHA